MTDAQALSDAAIVISNLSAEVAQLRVKADALTAENRVMREAISNAVSAPETGIHWARTATSLRNALDTPLAAREVERVKALEAVAVTMRENHGPNNGTHGDPCAQCTALAALDKLKGGET